MGTNILDQTKEEIQETTWNLCKQYDAQNKRSDEIRLMNFVSTELEKILSAETENAFREEWTEEVKIFCEKYSYQ